MFRRWPQAVHRSTISIGSRAFIHDVEKQKSSYNDCNIAIAAPRRSLSNRYRMIDKGVSKKPCEVFALSSPETYGLTNVYLELLSSTV